MTRSGQADMGHAHQSNQLQPLEARVAFLADDDVVVHRDAERFCDVDDRLRHLDVGLRGRRIARRMIVHQTTGCITALISRAVSSRWDEEGTGIGAASVSNFIIPLDHAASRRVIFDQS